eukprot:1346362-Amorphochlora_amoeboformis.AAC.1
MIWPLEILGDYYDSTTRLNPGFLSQVPGFIFWAPFWVPRCTAVPGCAYESLHSRGPHRPLPTVFTRLRSSSQAT